MRGHVLRGISGNVFCSMHYLNVHCVLWSHFVYHIEKVAGFLATSREQFSSSGGELISCRLNKLKNPLRTLESIAHCNPTKARGG